MALYLGIDGGGTGCRAAIADRAGRILARAEAGPANIASDPKGARDTIIGIVQGLLAGLGATEAAAVGLGLAGANAAGADLALQGALPARHVRIETDALTATLGALGDRDGIAAVIGTGAVFGRQQAGRFCQIGGHGLVLGDCASGAWLGRRALTQAVRADDGLVPMTPWLRDLLARFGGAAGIIGFAYAASPADFARLAPEVIAAADPDIMAEAEAEIMTAIATLQAGAALPVTFIGGLGEIYHNRLSGRLNTARPIGSALDGALRLAISTDRDAGPVRA
ncbi:BadF/BadG/BcrA/BcrD ATPase family protein [Paracoccus litorisediminis]|uniref:ATPase n=1 Tax=Paracoccus litorisediminis TaxID=2006130 RepID=A0A844HP35_9RHOB|nr:BadF/BadG/BcrA/BcrD ATPase family protein [Paracoccus litorisediminis]MTH59402.1 ATPase [Paracoccus litorisediminis]